MAKGSKSQRGAKKRGKKDEHLVVELPLKNKDEDEASIQDVGSFAFGYCTSCDWRGRARRSRDKARSDAREHRSDCSGKGKVHLAATDTKKVEDLRLP